MSFVCMCVKEIDVNSRIAFIYIEEFSFLMCLCDDGRVKCRYFGKKIKKKKLEIEFSFVKKSPLNRR